MLYSIHSAEQMGKPVQEASSQALLPDPFEEWITEIASGRH